MLGGKHRRLANDEVVPEIPEGHEHNWVGLGLAIFALIVEYLINLSSW